MLGARLGGAAGQLVQLDERRTQPAERDIACFAKIRFIELAATLADGIPVFGPHTPLLARREVPAGIIEREAARRLKPREPCIRLGGDLHTLAASRRLHNQRPTPDNWYAPGHVPCPLPAEHLLCAQSRYAAYPHHFRTETAIFDAANVPVACVTSPCPTVGKQHAHAEVGYRRLRLSRGANIQ